jgi:hypothetical protein
LGDQEKWPSQCSLNDNTILQLGLFCKREKSELSSLTQIFFHLWDHPDWLHNCYLDTQTLAILCKPQDKHGKEDQKSPLSMTKPPLLLHHPLPYLLSHPNIQNVLMGAFPLQQVMVGRGWIYALPSSYQI